MSADTDTLAEHLRRTALASDPIEGERLRNLVKARLLDKTAPETRIDRFVVLARLGAGGMGIVYAAYDPELDRKVAIKLVRTWGDERREGDQDRLVREARALAKLSHPNVVAVYEVGLHGDSVFLAMEFVQGQTLRQHVVAGRTSWRDALRVYLQAAEGLAAAHGAGLVHRDFKPDNAILGDDGRVRVVDFGLARGEGPSAPAATLRPAELDAETPLTETGALVGTPAYMAPEQRRGGVVGPKSDQFGFCAALHEALVGKPPAIELDEVAITLPPRLPSRLRNAITRGLAPAPDDRFADMGVLIAELRATTDTARRARVLALAAAVTGIAAGVAVPALLREPEPCPDPTAELVGTWDDATRATLHATASTLGDTAVASAVVVDRELDAWAQTWAAARRDACEALYVRKTDSPALFDRRMRCLDRRREAAADLVGLLAHSDPARWEHAVEAVVGLPGVEACADVEALTAATALPSDPARIAETDRLHGQIDRVETLERLARFGEAEPLAVATVRDAALVGDRATEAEAMRALATLYSAQHRDAEAEPLYVDAAWRAEAGHADELALDLLAKAMAMSAGRGRLDESEALASRVQGALERYGRPSPVEIQVLRSRFNLAVARSRPDEAEAYAREGLAVSTRFRGERSLDVARDLNNIGLVQYGRGDFAAARESFADALAIKREWLGPRHPDVIIARTNLAGVDERQGRTDDARAALESAIADAEQALTPSPVLGSALLNLANLHQQAGRFAEAMPLAQRALALFETSLGPKDVEMIDALNLLGVVYHRADRKSEARASFERSIEVADRISTDHPQKVYAWNNLAELERADGNLEAARELATKALELWVRTNGSEHPIAGQIAYTLSQSELALGRRDDAAQHAAHAIRVLERGGAVDAVSLAGARFVLARAQWPGGAGPRRDQAVAAGEAAAAAYETAGQAAEAAEVRGWLQMPRAR